MSLSPLGAKKVRKIEARVGLPVAWGSVNTSGEGKWQWRFWIKEEDCYRLGVWDLKEDTWEMTIVTRPLDTGE